MAPISEDTWKEILSNQKLDLIGTNKPNEGNGFHDGISWRIPFRPKRQYDSELYSSTFFTVYLRDLGLFINPSLSKKDKFENNFKIINCTENYYKTLTKYLSNEGYRSYGDILDVLGQWGEYLSNKGRLIFEIISWYDNDSSQFYAYKINLLENDYCRVGRKNIIYNAPFELRGNNEVFKKVKIPKKKCIIIEFPKELGGYKGFQKKVKSILGLGNQLYHSIDDPGKSLAHSKKWDKNFNKIVSDWGASNKQEDVTEFYQEYSALKFTYTVLLCTHQLIGGLSQLINHLNEKLNENAEIKFDLEKYDLKYFQKMQSKWINGELSFKEANELIRI